ncbi:MAG: hypothetical protein AAGA60_25550 [Cyanobacteria bacterium P01_E01_bin.42]
MKNRSKMPLNAFSRHAGIPRILGLAIAILAFQMHLSHLSEAFL